MAVDAGFSSLPFSPLPRLCHRIRHKCPPSRLFRGIESGGNACERHSKENFKCESLLGEELKGDVAVGFPETACKEVSSRVSWSKLALLLSPLTTSAQDSSSTRYVGLEGKYEYQWSPFNYHVRHDEQVRDDPVDSTCGFSAIVAVQSMPPPTQKQEDPEKQDFHVNVGYAIRTLREELPCMFYKELSYDIYREDIVFRDPGNMVAGIDNYKVVFRALRFHGKIFFKALWVDILRIWQPSDNVIMVRWQVRGVPRVPWEAQGVFDGTSEYKLDKRGKIYEHKVDNVALNARPKFKVPSVEEMLRVACPSTPKPTFYQKSQVLLTALLPYLMQFTWIRYYWALRETF
ncbi:hypothetical protein KP509_07G081200 [Ceratopteris richardii]|uniref:Uncharacterized protein n=1 Tax=Ceratopteris richardii TaxID=49495 RepID=A0A8T2UCK3_CERRI|nr:hypothetical protein KP509_07G081200 [Ceratopteris richardii]